MRGLYFPLIKIPPLFGGMLMSGQDDKPNFVCPADAGEAVISLGGALLRRSMRATSRPPSPRLRGTLALAPERVYHEPVSPPAEMRGSPPSPRLWGTTSHHFSPFSPIALATGDSIVSVALSLGLRINVRHVSFRLFRYIPAAVSGSP